jgi:hypothetical protein
MSKNIKSFSLLEVLKLLPKDQIVLIHKFCESILLDKPLSLSSEISTEVLPNKLGRKIPEKELVQEPVEGKSPKDKSHLGPNQPIKVDLPSEVKSLRIVHRPINVIGQDLNLDPKAASEVSKVSLTLYERQARNWQISAINLLNKAKALVGINNPLAVVEGKQIFLNFLQYLEDSKKYAKYVADTLNLGKIPIDVVSYQSKFGISKPEFVLSKTSQN